MIMLGTLPSLENTYHHKKVNYFLVSHFTPRRFTVSSFPTISDIFRGRYFSTLHKPRRKTNLPDLASIRDPTMVCFLSYSPVSSLPAALHQLPQTWQNGDQFPRICSAHARNNVSSPYKRKGQLICVIYYQKLKMLTTLVVFLSVLLFCKGQVPIPSIAETFASQVSDSVYKPAVVNH